uniref:AAA+ ATPase domain-containing protein n=1 Tax=Glossina palpalis gambiensis TaxID=67801 RepID=A0A1B0BJ75_9MUSC
MGNVCSSGQNKKKGSISEKSEDSYNDTKADNNVSTTNVPPSTSQVGKVPITTKHEDLPDESSLTNTDRNAIQSDQSNSVATSTTTTTAAQIATELSDLKSMSNISLAILRGKFLGNRKTERHKKIVVYILTDNSQEHKKHKRIIHGLQKQFTRQCQSRDFEFVISDIHDMEISVKADYSRLSAINHWSQSPLEAQGGHEEAANALSELSRHSASAYIIPVLFLGSNLGVPMLPLTIESQDFTSVLSAANETERILLEKWYTIDNLNQPMCHRLHTQQIEPYSTKQDEELNKLFGVLLNLFSNDLKDSYMSTVVEQEVNNTVLISQELAKRCIWIQTGPHYMKAPENASPYELEVLRRISKLYSELKTHLSEKNMVRILPNMNVLDDELAEVIESLIDKSITTIIDEYANKNSLPDNTNGVNHALIEEIEFIGQYTTALAQNSPNFDIMNDIKRYIKDSTDQPLVVCGPSGCGKSVLISKIVENLYRWKPETNLILRYANLTARSGDLVTVLGSIANQMSALAYGYQTNLSHTFQAYAQIIQKIIDEEKCFFIIIIDSVDELLGEDIDLTWLPFKLKNMCKVILTVTERTDKYEKLLHKLTEYGLSQKCFINMKQFTDRQWNDILCSGGGDFYVANRAIKMPDEWKNLHGRTPFHAKSLWWMAWLGCTSTSMNDISEVLHKVLQVLETKFSSDHAELLLLIVSLSEWGIRESDCIQILQRLTKLDAQAAFNVWSRFCWLMGPMLLCIRNIKITDTSFRITILEKYKKNQSFVHKAIRDFFDRQDSYFVISKELNKIYNYQKFLKLPYHHFSAVIEDNLGPNAIDILFNCFYFTDLQWIADKVHACGPIHLMHDIWVSEKISGIPQQSYLHIRFLKEFLTNYMHELDYDGHQFFTLIKFYLKTRIKQDANLKDDEKVRSWLEFTNEIEIPFLEILNGDWSNGRETGHGDYNVLVNLPHKGYFVAAISTIRGDICIWDVKSSRRVRVLEGIPQPTAMCPCDTYDAAVLCRREIKVINLDEGKFKVTLKGVMNQKMPYFGLHDQKHLVCLSRNRMYVNLMNLESGDCVTTFKAGEDRFLNSLLVSGDGRILVCGDETQKPFPLLVWHLTQRKLLYDLRIPCHDFITSLSAITHEGSYVCVVAKELNEPTPNFIVVYDLQSGTLFKKWKPSCNTVALAISQVNACVIAGLDDAKILVWDLVTGNCRSTLTGHNAPVTCLKLDPLGRILLSTDKEGRDNSFRVWETSTGKSLAVLKLPDRISACEILPNGAFVAVALEGRSDLMILALKNYGDSESDDDNPYIYGNQDNQDKVFKLEPN